VILPGFEHRPGVHCGSTALCDALRVRGLELSEPMAFGLGAGLGFSYLHVPTFTPSLLILGRSPGLERNACEALGAPSVERTADGAAAALAGVRDALARGFAPILSTELSRLPYWRARTPFGGHRVVLAGLDGERGTAFLADTDRPALQEVELTALDEARAALAPPFAAEGRPWLEVDAPASPRPLAEAAREALRRQAREMLADDEGLVGVSALERFGAELPSWPSRAAGEKDLSRCLRYAYQVIEVRGTGGGLFRRLYARFLRELDGASPELAPRGLAPGMEALADRWTHLAHDLRRLGAEEAEAGELLPEVAAQAQALAAGERRFFEGLAAALP
jgi:hypothetical protein